METGPSPNSSLTRKTVPGRRRCRPSSTAVPATNTRTNEEDSHKPRRIHRGRRGNGGGDRRLRAGPQAEAPGRIEAETGGAEGHLSRRDRGARQDSRSEDPGGGPEERLGLLAVLDVLAHEVCDGQQGPVAMQLLR